MGRAGRIMVALCAAGGLGGVSTGTAHAVSLPSPVIKVPALHVKAGPGHLQLTNALARAQAAGRDLLGLGLPIDIPMMNGGGPVEGAGSTNYVIFWEPAGSTVSGTYHTLVQRYFNDIGGTPFYGLMGQYSGIANISNLGGSWTDTRTFPAAPLQDSDIQAEVTHAMAANGWSAGIGHEFFVFTPKNINSCMAGSCSFTTFCAYHNHFASGGADVLYADMPYAGTNLSACGVASSPNNDADADAEISIISHEHFETVTDPDLNAWSDLLGNEIGDKCRNSYGPTIAGGGDVALHGHNYLVQEEYSNKAFPLLGACALS